MEFNITPEFAQEIGLSDEQVTKIVDHSNTTVIPEIKNHFESEYKSTANENAEKILGGAASSLSKVFGFDKNDGEKIAEYVIRGNQAKAKEYDSLKSEYETKLKEAPNAEALEKQYAEKYKNYDEFAKKAAELENVAPFKDKYDTLSVEHERMKQQVAFADIKPVFPDTVNKYEAKAKWDKFKSKVLAEWDIQFVDDKSVLVNKENKHKTMSLSDALSKDEDLISLSKGREQGGSGATPSIKKDVEGVPFQVPVDADDAQVSKIIKDHLATKGIGVTDPRYANSFKDFNAKIRAAQKTA